MLASRSGNGLTSAPALGATIDAVAATSTQPVARASLIVDLIPPVSDADPVDLDSICHAGQVKGPLLVGAQMLLLAALGVSAWLADAWATPLWTRLVGLAFAASGAVLCFAAFPQLGRALTPLPEPREDAELTTSGLYAHMRHPIYTGVLVTAWGWTATFPSGWTLACAAALTVLLAAKARYEEGLLRARFAEYTEYTARTPRFVPRPW